MSKPKTPQAPCKPWWPGNAAVERYMLPVAEAISRHIPKGGAWTDIYNRAYEAVHSALNTSTGEEQANRHQTPEDVFRGRANQASDFAQWMDENDMAELADAMRDIAAFLVDRSKQVAMITGGAG